MHIMVGGAHRLLPSGMDGAFGRDVPVLSAVLTFNCSCTALAVTRV